MPKPLPEYLVYFLSDCLQGDTVYTTKSMFGWYGIYKHGQIFAIYARDTIYMKVGEGNRQDYVDAKSKQFVYDKKGTKCYLNYWQLPEEVLENPEELIQWIDTSLAVKKK